MSGDVIKSAESSVAALRLSHFLLKDLCLEPADQKENSRRSTNDDAEHDSAGNGSKAVMGHSVIAGRSHVPKISANWALTRGVLAFAVYTDAVILTKSAVTR